LRHATDPLISKKLEPRQSGALFRVESISGRAETYARPALRKAFAAFPADTKVA
jgi:hypothetical protein